MVQNKGGYSMTIKKGIVTQIRNEGEATRNSRAVIVEKTKGTYKEVLICRESHELFVDDMVVNADYQNTFTVYVGKTVEHVLGLNDITDYTWVEPLTEV
jgi:hypothetical protein